MQVTEVTKPLVSVGKICNAGNRVVFEPEGGYIESVTTGARTNLTKAGTAWRLDVWIKARNDEDITPVEAEEQAQRGNGPFNWQGTP